MNLILMCICVGWRYLSDNFKSVILYFIQTFIPKFKLFLLEKIFLCRLDKNLNKGDAMSELSFIQFFHVTENLECDQSFGF